MTASERSELSVTLRRLSDSDLPALFQHQRDAEANRMAAFGAKDPDDREAFDRRWERILSDKALVGGAIEVDGKLAGSILLWRDPALDAPEVTYWLGREFWGRGVATAALRAFLLETPTRPLYGRVASTNPASFRVLTKCGFRHVDTLSAVQGTTGIVDEHILRLDSPTVPVGRNSTHTT